MTNLLSLALAPTMLVAFYIYIRDKYEKEPLRMLILGLIYGIVIIAPIVQTENFMMRFMPNSGVLAEALYSTFMVASLVEEGFKYVILFFLVWKNNNFNERFDGIVYAVFISLGFAGVENILYVLNPTFGGLNTAISRAIFSVPGHALFGVSMGYYLALSKFEPQHKKGHMIKAFVVPFVLHGFYDFILAVERPNYMLVFIPFVAYMWVNGFKKMKHHVRNSEHIVRE